MIARSDPFEERRRRVIERTSLFRELIDRSRDAIFVTDPETGRFLWVSLQAAAGLGYSREELLGLRTSDVEETLPTAEAWQEHLRLLRAEGTVVVAGRHRRRDGRTFPVEVSIQLATLEGEPYLVAVARDVSTRARDESFLAEYRECLEEVVEERSSALRQAVIAQEAANVRLAAAEKALRERLDREQLIARTLERFVTRGTDEAIEQTLADLGAITGADRAYLFRFSDDLDRMSNTHEWCAPGVPPELEKLQDLPCATFPWWVERMALGAPLRIDDVAALPEEAAAEREILAAQGIRTLLSLPFQLDGRPAGFMGLDNVREAGVWTERELTTLGIATGIVAQVLGRRQVESDLARQEALHRTLVDGASDSIFFVDRELRVGSVNPAGARLIGRAPAEVTGRTLVEIFGEAQGRKYSEAILGVMRSGRPVVEQGTLDLGSRTLWLLTTLSPVLSPGGAPSGVIGVTRDVTELRELEQQVRQSQKMDALGRLAAGIAHDFNNLLAVIQGSAGLLAQTIAKDDPRRVDAVEIARAGERAAALTAQLLAFSRRQPLEPRRLALRRVLGDVQGMLQRLVGAGVALEVENETRGVTVLAPPGTLEQVLVNLVVNARDAMPLGGTVRVVAREVPARRRGPGGTLGAEAAGAPGAEPAPQQEVELVVADTGTGMAPDVVERAFEPFFTTKPEGQGTGLGLATVYGIVQQLGGRVRIVSAPGEGTSVHVVVPAAGRSSTEHRAATSPRAAGAGALEVLLVDDEPAVGRMMARMLTLSGHRVTLAAGAAEALVQHDALAPPPDLLVTDVVMPGGDGVSLARELRPDFPGRLGGLGTERAATAHGYPH